MKKKLELKYDHFMGDEYEYNFTPFLLIGFEIGGEQYSMLVSTKNGNRFRDPVIVGDYQQLTKEEFEKLTNNKEFELIKRYHNKYA